MIPWFQYTNIHIGPLTLQVWGFFVALGILVSCFIIKHEASCRKMNAEPLLDLALKMIISGVVCARLFHIVFYEPAYFIAHPLEVIALWHGGLSSFGGIAGAVLFLMYRVFRGRIEQGMLLVYGNILAYASVFGWMIGRVGCLMIHDHLGRESSCPLALASPYGTRLDMAFLEIIGMLPLAIIFLVLKKRNIHDLFAPILFVYYGVLRFILDFWRAEPTFATGDVRYLGLTPAQYFSIVLMFIGIYSVTQTFRSDRRLLSKVKNKGEN